MKATMTELYRGCMRGRTMYVIPFVMGHLDSEHPMFGVEITDSAYVVASMRIMSRMGTQVLRRIEELGEDADYVPCIHSVGMPLEPGQDDVAWPCSDTKYIGHFPEERMIWTLRLRLRRQLPARQEVLRPAHRVARWPATRAGWPSTC